MTRAWQLGLLGAGILALGIGWALPAQQRFVSAAVEAPGTAALLPRCHTTQLQGSLGRGTAGAGSIFPVLVLRNVGTTTCGVFGYPGVSLLDAQGRQIGHPALWVPGVRRLVTVRPGGVVSAAMRLLNPGVAGGNCLARSTTVRVYPPDERAALLVPGQLQQCMGVFEVKPLVAGTAGL
jgi:Protein of unknown function (DUF4232)